MSEFRFRYSTLLFASVAIRVRLSDMPAARITPQRVHAREAATLRAESLRSSIPLGQYLNMLHEAVTTGEMPVLTKDFRPTGVSAPISTTERTRLLQYLVDKAMPAPAHPNSITQDDPSHLLENLTPDQVRRLTLGELQRLLAPPTPPNPDNHDPSHPQTP